MRTLEDLLEEITPSPDPDFVEEMERRMQAGFPPRRSAGARRATGLRLPEFAARLAPSRLRIPRAAAAVAASATLALVVTVSLVAGGDGEGPATVQPVGDAGGGAAERRAEDHGIAREAAPADMSSTTAMPMPIPPPGDPVGRDLAARADQRRVERSAQLTLAAEPDEFDGLSDSVFRVTGRHDGFVVRSSLTEGESGLAGGFFELRIPADRLDRALNELSRLATVRSRSESGTDVTGTFVSIRDRLRRARAEQTGLLRRLERADTDDAMRAIQRQLDVVESRIASLRGQLRGIRERTNYATVLVDLVDEDAGAVSGPTGRAVDDAVGSLEDVLTFSIRALGVLIPLGLAALLGWLAASRARRRARERALA